MRFFCSSFCFTAISFVLWLYFEGALTCFLVALVNLNILDVQLHTSAFTMGLRHKVNDHKPIVLLCSWVHCACNSTEKWNIWVFERGGEVPSCITDVCTLHECHAASLSCFSSLPRINSLLLANQINTPQQSLRRFHFSMKWTSLWRYQPVCVCVCVVFIRTFQRMLNFLWPLKTIFCLEKKGVRWKFHWWRC